MDLDGGLDVGLDGGLGRPRLSLDVSMVLDVDVGQYLEPEKDMEMVLED